MGVEILVSVVVFYQGTIKDSTTLNLELPSGHFRLSMTAVYWARKGVTILARVINPNYHEGLH